MSHPSDFDEYAERYDELLETGLAVTGEGKDYYARERVLWLARRLNGRGFRPRCVMDFGCGTGGAIPYLLEYLQPECVVGVDVSSRSLELAAKRFGSERVRLRQPDDLTLRGEVDLAFSNGVFHHIPPDERPPVVRRIHRALKPGSFFALWENNPWNPGTRYLMDRCPLDRDAVALTPPECRKMLRAEGFEIVDTDFIFFFPRALRGLRWVEPWLARLPLGGQYQVLSRKRGDGDGAP